MRFRPQVYHGDGWALSLELFPSSLGRDECCWVHSETITSEGLIVQKVKSKLRAQW